MQNFVRSLKESYTLSFASATHFSSFYHWTEWVCSLEKKCENKPESNIKPITLNFHVIEIVVNVISNLL